ncbi:MAG TPA: hypothetical protein VF263_23330 [Longimicrobiaceae bacterium]
MKKVRTILMACVMSAGLASCGETSMLLAPESPRQNGGYTIGSGGRAMAADSTSTTERGGGYTIGSGG